MVYGLARMLKSSIRFQAVHLDFLVEEAWRHRHVLRRLQSQRPAGAGAFAGVHVLVHAQVGLHGVHEPAERRVVGGDPHRRGVAHRHVDRDLGAAAHAALTDRVERELPEAVRDSELRLIRDVAERAGERARPEQRALRSSQHLDAGHVEQVDVRSEQGKRDDGLVEVDADLLLDAGLVADDLPGCDAAHRDLALAGTEVLHREARDVGRDLFEVADAAAAQDLLAGRDDGEGHLLEVLFPLSCRNGDLLGVGLPRHRPRFVPAGFLRRGRSGGSVPEGGQGERQ